jgi:ribonuclease HI
MISQTITLYVDGACKGNPGLGGWGAYIITKMVNINFLVVKPKPPTIAWN